MKFKPSSKSGGLQVELKPGEEQIPFKAPAGNEPLPIFRLGRILVPVDFSACSNKALQYALPLAKQFDASIVLLHVVQPHVPVPEMSTVDVGLLEVELREGGTKQLIALKQTVGAEVPVETELRIGNPYLEIINAVGPLGIDLIVLSTHGRTGLAHVFMGSVAERVVRHAPCPVLVVREEEREFLKTTGAGAGVAGAESKESARKASPSARGGFAKRVSVILAVVLSVTATLSLGVAQSRRQRATKEFMQDKLALSQQVLAGLVKPDFDLIATKARKLSAMSKEADWRVFENPEYDQHSLVFRRYVDALAKAGQEKNLDAATLAYVRMTISCVDCHKFVRGKLVASADRAPHAEPAGGMAAGPGIQR